MTNTGSVTDWIAQLKAGQLEALTELQKRYWPFLTRLAERKLHGVRRAADEEDVAQDALLGFYQSLERGAFPELRTRHDLLAVLAIITARKAAHQIERESRKKRGGGRVRGESALEGLLESGGRGIEQFAAGGPTAAEQALLKDHYEKFLSLLPDNLRPFAELHLAGYTYRKMSMIRERWRAVANETDLAELL